MSATLLQAAPALPPTFDITVFVWLLLVASLVALAVKRFQLPYALALVVTGLVLGLTHWLPQARLEPHTLFTLFLPPLLFEAALSLHGEHLLEDWLSIGVLSVVGTVISTVVTGGLVAWGLGLAWPSALVFGALVAPTDPISVIAILRRLNAHPRLTLLVEAESLFNDGVAVVVFVVLLGLARGQDATWPLVFQHFVVTLIGGTVVGAGLGALVSRVVKLVDDPLLELMLTTVAAYGAYLLAEACHTSGVIAVVASGLVVGNYGMTRAMSAETRAAVIAFWAYAAFVVNSIVFLLIGTEADLVGWWQLPRLVAGAIGAVLAGRAVAIYGLSPLLAAAGETLPMSWRHVLVWGGLRGALSLALALGLPADLPYRDMIVAMTFGYVLFSLLVQGLTVGSLIRRLGLVNPEG